MAGPKTRELLKGSSILRCLSERQLETLELHVRTVRFPANKTVFRKGDPGDTMMIVVNGRIKITTTSMDGSEMIINTILPGEVVGEIALLDGQERTADAVTAEETDALVIRRDDFALLLKDSAELCLSVIDLLCDKLRRTTELAEESVFLELSERLLKRLQTYCEADAKPDRSGGLRIEHGLSQQGLADELGVTRESVNRQLAEWRDLGLVPVGQAFLKQDIQPSETTGEMLEQAYLTVCRAVEDAFKAVTKDDQRAAQDVLVHRDEFWRLSEQVLRRQAERLARDDPDRLTKHRLQTDILDKLRRIYLLADHIAAGILPANVAAREYELNVQEA